MERAAGRREDEIINQPTVAPNRLGADPGEGRHEVTRRKLGHEPRCRAGERPGNRRMVELGKPGSPVAADQSPGPRPSKRARKIARRTITHPPTVTGRRDQRRRSDQHVAVDVAGQVDAEKRQARVRDRVDQRPDEPAALRAQAQVRAAEGDDPRIGVRSGRDRQAVSPRTGAEDGAGRLEHPAGVLEENRPPPVAHEVHAATERERPTGESEVRGKCPGHRGEVDDARRRRMERGHPHRVRLDRGQTARIEAAQTDDAVALPATLKIVEPAELGRRAGNDQLAAALVGDSVGRAELIHLARAVDAQTGLERPRHIIDSGVDHAGVVPALMEGHLSLALEHADPLARVASGELAGDAEPEDAGSDDRKIAALRGFGHPQTVWLIRRTDLCPRLPWSEMQILVTGVSGFVGSVLTRRLAGAGHELRGLTRNPAAVDPQLPIEVHRGDALSGAGLGRALDGVDVAYYLIHSMEAAAGGDFARRDQQAAKRFADVAAAAGVGRIVYLGGLVPTAGPVSDHLRSRAAVEDALLDAIPDSVILRASIIIGAESRSFRFLVRLVERMPVLALPKWRVNRTQPLDERDMVEYLVGAATGAVGGRRLDIGGPDTITYGAMIERIASLMLVGRPAVRLGFALTPVASVVAARITGEELALAGPLMASLATDLLADDRDARALLPVRLHTFDAAVERALRDWERREPLRAR